MLGCKFSKHAFFRCHSYSTCYNFGTGKEKKGARYFLSRLSYSLGNQPRDVANNLEAYQEGINWFIEGEIPSKELVNLSMVWKCGLGLQMILWHIILYFLGDPLLQVAEGRLWRTHISFSHTCVMKGISMFLVLLMVRGAAAAEFSARAFPGFLQAISSISSPSSALFEAFVKTDIVFRADVGLYRKSKRVIQKDWHPGCTAAAAFIGRNKLFVANAGDCRTIVCGAGLATPLF